MGGGMNSSPSIINDQIIHSSSHRDFGGGRYQGRLGVNDMTLVNFLPNSVEGEKKAHTYHYLYSGDTDGNMAPSIINKFMGMMAQKRDLSILKKVCK